MAVQAPTGTMSRPQTQRRRRIVQTAAALAVRGGVEAMQMRSVAERAGVALGTLYRYFPSKIHLLVSALGREFEQTQAALARRPLEGDTPADRVVNLLAVNTRGMQREPHLTEALTRAFMFADSSVVNEIHVAGMYLTNMLTRAMKGDDAGEPTEDDIAIARVIGDVWMANLVAWVTGRASTADVARSMDVAVRLILR